MKKFLSLFFVLCMMLLCFAACDKVEDEKTPSGDTVTETPDGGDEEPGEEVKILSDEEKYADALRLIEEGKYTEAYATLKALGEDYKDVKTQLGFFRYVPTKVVCTESYEDESEILDVVYTYEGNRLVQMSEIFSVYDGVETVVGSPDDSIRVFTYDANGYLIGNTVTDADDGDKRGYSYMYDINGNCLKEVYTYSNGEKDVYDYQYDEKGDLVEETYTRYDEHGTISAYSPCSTKIYDASGKPILQTTTWSDGDTTTSYYTYDEKGNLTKVVTTYSDGDTYETTFTYTYDTNGNVLKSVSLDFNGATTINEYVYDDNGNMIQHVSTDELGTTVRICAYDANGKLISETVTWRDGGTYTCSYTYNDGGKLIRRVRMNGDGEIGETLDCTYDENGNLNKAVVTHIKEEGAAPKDEWSLEATYKFVYIPYELHEDIEEAFDVREWLY